MLSSISPYGDTFHYHTNGRISMAITRSARRGPWLPEEDNTLLQLVRTQGANNWVRISQQLQHRSPKQCRERYHQNLKPSLKHDPISAQEGEVIEHLVQEMGKRWAEIARRLGNRSDNAVKNWWNGSVNRRRRNPTHSTTAYKQVGNRLHPVPFTLPAEHCNTTHARSRSRSDDHENLIDHHPSQRLSPQRPRESSLQSSTTILPHSSSTPNTRGAYVLDTSVSRQDRPPSSSALSARLPLPRVEFSEPKSQLPPLRSSSLHVSLGDRHNFSTEYPPVSPALSETSQQHPPSLISDCHSFCSVSPRTIATPRSGIPAPVEIGNIGWSDSRKQAQHMNHLTAYNTLQEINQYSRYPISSNSTGVSILNDERTKDLRMNVATLLQ